MALVRPSAMQVPCTTAMVMSRPLSLLPPSDTAKWKQSLMNSFPACKYMANRLPMLNATSKDCLQFLNEAQDLACCAGLYTLSELGPMPSPRLSLSATTRSNLLPSRSCSKSVGKLMGSVGNEMNCSLIANVMAKGSSDSNYV